MVGLEEEDKDMLSTTLEGWERDEPSQLATDLLPGGAAGAASALRSGALGYGVGGGGGGGEK